MAENNVNGNALNAFLNSQKIPESIKGIPVYSGDTKNLFQWLKNVDAVVAILENAPASQEVQVIWMNNIRAKIIDKANDALIAKNLEGTWANMRETLIEYFGDRRDITTLTQSIPYMAQYEKSLDEFYHEFNELSASINQKILLDNNYEGHEGAVMHFVNGMLKDAFIDGLNEPISSYTRNYRPADMVDAYRAAQEQLGALGRKAQKISIQNPNKTRLQANNFQRPQNYQNYQNNNQQQYRNQRFPNRQNFQQNLPQNVQQNFQQNLPHNVQQNTPQRNVLQRYNNPQRNTQNQPGPSGQYRSNNYDQSMRSRQSNQMSGISYNSNNKNQLNFKFLYGHYKTPQSVIKNCIPYINTSSGILKFLIDTGSNKSYIKPCHVKPGKARDTQNFQINTVSGNININKFVLFNPFPQSKLTKLSKFYVHNFHNFFDGLRGYELLQNLNSIIDTKQNILTCVDFKIFMKKKFPILRKQILNNNEVNINNRVY